jgi:chloramphenicol-sensitive protein RarD
VDDRRQGLAVGLGAYALWGLFPLYFPLLVPAGGVEIVAHRVLWSLLFVALLLTATRGWRKVRAAVVDVRTMLLLAGAAVLVSGNWLVFVHGVNSGQVVQTSLGYFINPLVSVLLGVVVLSERLRPLQWAAVGVAAAAVTVLTLDYGRPPWIALGLAATFGFYGLLKKVARVPAAPGLLVETAMVAVPAAVAIAVLHAHGVGTAGNAGAGHLLLLMGSGAVTAVPLLLFATATRRVPLSTLGLLQYLTPMMHLAIGVFVYGEPMPPVRLLGFVIVWLALALLTADSLRQARTARRRDAGDALPAGL